MVYGTYGTYNITIVITCTYADAGRSATQGLTLNSHEHAAFVRQLGGDNLLVESWSEAVQAAYSQAEGASDFVAIAKAGAISGALQLYSRTDLELWGIAPEATQAVASADGTATIMERQQVLTPISPGLIL
jgi:hypothetical protein